MDPKLLAIMLAASVFGGLSFISYKRIKNIKVKDDDGLVELIFQKRTVEQKVREDELFSKKIQAFHELVDEVEKTENTKIRFSIKGKIKDDLEEMQQ